ncbi:MAG: hypothetical protein NTV23_04940 [Propionibacteriales bacterium]|nr:hypothetical protein [Propionibacteriales bacterium]
MRVVVVVLVLLLGLTGCSPLRSVTATAGPEPGRDPLRVLHDWDAARASTWARDDPVALAGLYVPGSVAGARDVALLRRYQRRGIRLESMQMQVLSLRIVIRRQDRLRLVVVERFAGARAVTATGARQVPAGAPVRRMIDLRRPADRWLVAAVRPLPPAGSR